MATTWTKLAKATGTSWTKVAKPAAAGGTATTIGSPIGLLLALTYSTTTTVGATWTKISKASGTSWTKVVKAT